MIRVNLVGDSKKKNSKTQARLAVQSNLLPMVLVAIAMATAIGGYSWHSSLSSRAGDLTLKISQAEAQKATLEAVITQDRIYESRKKELENRIKIIDGLKRNQVSPVVSLDILDDAVDKTEYVWLSNLDQNNTSFSLSGVGTSVNALADFVSNLEATGYFRNINLVNAQDAAGRYTFSMTCEFGVPVQRPSAAPAQISGGN